MANPTLEQLSQALALIHEAAASPERWTDALGALGRLCESPKASILDVDLKSGRLVGITETGHDPAARKEYAEYYYSVDPTAEVAVRALPQIAFTAYDYFPREVRARSEYFAYATRCDIGDVIGVATGGSLGVRSLLGLQRSVKAPSYGADAKRLVELIAPHLEVAKRVQARVSEAVAARDSLAAGLDRLIDAAFIVDASRKIRHLNASAHKLLATDARLRGKDAKLSFASPRLQSAFQAAVDAAAARKVRSQLLALPAAGSGESSEIAVCPLQDSHALASSWQTPLVLVMVSVPQRDAAAIAARMRQLYGLTPAEARVVAWLALGRSVEEIARDSGVRESTVQSQLRSIRAKTGVSRQAELVRLALTGASIS